MILIAILLISIFIAWVGLCVWSPYYVDRALKKFLHEPVYYCDQCHHDITVGNKFRLDFKQHEELEGRQV